MLISVLYRYVPGSRIAGSYGSLFLIFWWLFIPFSIAAVAFYSLINSAQGFQLLHLLSLCFVHVSLLNWCFWWGQGHASYSSIRWMPVSPPSVSFVMGLELRSLNAGKEQSIGSLTLGISLNHLTETCFTAINYVFQITWII